MGDFFAYNFDLSKKIRNFASENLAKMGCTRHKASFLLLFAPSLHIKC